MDDEDRGDGERKRQVLRDVAAYRTLCRQVRTKATGGLVFGVFLLVIWYLVFGQFNNFGPFSLISLGLGCLEMAAALWNKLRPSAEGVLIDGVVLFGFGAANLLRQFLIWQGAPQGPPQTSTWLIVFAALWVFQGVNQMRSYARLRRAFGHRPTAEHLRWFDGLLREVRDADPENDPTALDLPTRPPMRGKLLGDTAVFLQAGTDVPIIAAREDVEIERVPPRHPDRPPGGYLSVEDLDYGGFPLDPENWRNYALWKTEGGQPPPPMKARPVDRE